MKNRYNRVQCLRGLFILMIMGFHYTIRYSQLFGNQHFYVHLFEKLALIGLCGFLFISGFYTMNTETQPIQYLKKRVGRLYPKYILALLIIFVVNQIFPIGHGRDSNFLCLLSNTLFINKLLKLNFVDGAHWYVIFTIAMVLLYVTLIWILKNNIKVCFALLIFLILLFTWTEAFERKGLRSMNDLFSYFCYYVSGMLLSAYSKNSNNRTMFFWGEVVILIGLIFALGLTDTMIVVLVELMTGVCLLRNKEIKTLFVPIAELGNKSYMIYLLHQNIGFTVIYYISKSYNLSSYMVVVVALISMVFFGYIVDVIYNGITEYCLGRK